MAGRIALSVLIAGLVATLAVALLRDEPDTDPKYTSVEQVSPDLTGADPRLKQIVAQANELLPGEAKAFDARREELKGLPIVANKWASWCHPCVAESPAFQQTAKKLGNRVAFLGVDVFDAKDGAKAFLAEHPMPYPSYSDPDTKISKAFPPPGSPPVTNFYDADGRLTHTEAGQITSAAELEDLIERYAGPIPTEPGG